MIHKKSEKGQAIILIVFALIGLIGITGLTVDGGMAYSDRRRAQNAADSAAFAAALANTKNENIEAAAQSIAAINGFNDDGVQNEVVITYATSPADTCPEESPNNMDITVEITSHANTYFAPIVGIRTMTNKVTATTRACGTYIAPLFGGNAVVGLNTSTPCAFDSDTGSATWKLTGGGIFSNGCATAKGNVVLDPDQCVKAVGNASTFGSKVCSGGPFPPYDQAYIDSIMPPDPCDGTPGDVGLSQPSTVKVKGKASVTLSNGVYCITNFDDYDSTDIILNNATLYVTDPVFKLNFSGNGGFSGTPTKSGTYSSYYMIIRPNSAKCTKFSQGPQAINYRGNGLGSPYGTILAPTACIDLRGNSNDVLNGQLIGYTVSANGNASATVNYVDDQNRREPMNPTIELIK